MIARCTVDPSIDGRQFGHLEVALQEQAALGSSASLGRSSVCIIRRGDGPMITLLAGTQGEAAEASAVLNRLARNVDPDSVTGTLVIIPWIDLADEPAIENAFPGEKSGSYAMRLTDLITQLFINNASLVVNFKSGGKHFGFASAAAVVQQADRKLQEQAEANMIAFGAPNSVRLPDQFTCGLDRTCIDADVPCIHVLIGGQGVASAEALDVAHRGCQNLFSTNKLIDQELALCATRMLEVREDYSWVHAPKAGLQSGSARIGGEVWRGDVLIEIQDPSALATAPHQLNVPRDSIVLGMRQSGNCQAGDCLMLLADEVQR